LVLQISAEHNEILLMRVTIRAKAHAREEKIEKASDNTFIVSVKEPPRNGMANRAIARVLAEYFHVPQASITLVSGFSSKQKIFEISE
jgi:uncharacterized protein YggU (UPF0235/DUF167 family)